MIQNPDFSFPMQPQPPARKRQDHANELSKRPASMHIDLPRVQNADNSHRRTASTLPSFNFNAADTSGLGETETPPRTPDEDAPATPSRKGHRRGGSEFVGGDSRFGVSNAVSSSPTKSSASLLPAPVPGPPPSRRGHAHRRSAAMSSHDVGALMHPSTDVQPRLSSSLPTTPMEHPAESANIVRPVSSPETKAESSNPFGLPLEDSTARPPSRPRVGFSDNVEYIPRPLSTISSETESSVSTIRGHSVDNSISSVLSLSTPSPPSSRSPRPLLSAAAEDESKSRARSSLEIGKRIEKEGEWLKSRSGSPKRPVSESAVATPNTTFAVPETPARPRSPHKKKHSIGHALGFDRRKSEPTIGMSTSGESRLSAVSLQDLAPARQSAPDAEDCPACEQKSSTKRLKDWATSKIPKRTRDNNKGVTARSSTSSIRPGSAGSVSIPGRVPMGEPTVAETDLDAVFSSQASANESQRSSTPVQTQINVNTPTPSQHSSGQGSESDESDPVLDLDAALGPFQTPSIGPNRQRKELHSSRLTKDFTGPGGHYHRRAESAPALAPFEAAKTSVPAQGEMADVFEEEEEEDLTAQPAKPPSTYSAQDDESNVGVEIVDSDSMVSGISGRADDGLGIRENWEPERPTTSHGNTTSRFGSSSTEGRGSSIVEETIMEEPSPSEGVEIVEAHEEPRTSSLTKSSDSSDTPTVLVPTTDVLALPDGQQSSITPATSQTSTFSSPDLGRWQGSFDASRLGTTASSIADTRTMSSSTTADHRSELRDSVDDVPSLTSSRSTMVSTNHTNNSRRDFSGDDRPPPAVPRVVDPAVAAERRRKRGSIQSLSQLVGGSFGSKSKGYDDSRPHTAAESISTAPKKKEHRLKKLMFWKSKQHGKQSTHSHP